MIKGFKVRDKRSRGWFYIDNEYLNGYAKVFGPIGSGIYLSLCRHVDQNQKCFPSEKLLAKELAVGERTIRKYLKELENWNLISIEKTRSPQGKFLHNLYWLIDKSEWRKKPSANCAVGTEIHKPEANNNISQGNVVPDKDTNSKNTHNKKAIETIAGKEINYLISLFEEVNPSIRKYYPNITQRKSIERMLEQFGYEKLESLIKALPEINEKKYWPKSTTPSQLEDNLGKYKALSNQEKAEKSKFIFI